MGFSGGLVVKNLPAMQETQVWSLGWEDPLEKGMATHSSILAWRILWIEEPGGLQSMGSQRVRHDWVTNAHTKYKYSHFEGCGTLLVFKKIFLKINLFLTVLGLCCFAWTFSSCGEEGCSLLWCEGISLWCLPLLWGSSSTAQGLQWLCAWAVTLRHVGSYLTRDQTHVSCVGSQILNHWTTREAPLLVFKETG